MAKGTLHLNVEFSAVTDEEGKFGRLATLLGLADADHARGKCEHLWLACTRRGEAALPQWLVEQLLGERGPEALVEAELASWSRGRGDSKTRMMRIGGAAKHCLWMVADQAQKQEQRRKGGKTRADTSSRQLDGKFAPAGATQPAEHPAQSSSSEISSASEIREEDPPPARDLAVPTAVGVEYRRAAVAIVFQQLEDGRREVAGELGVTAQPLLAFDPGRQELQAKMANERTMAEVERVVDVAKHVVAMALLEARRDRTVQWLTGRIFVGDQFTRLAGMTAEDATRPRAGPRSSAARAAKSDPRVGRISGDRPPSDYPDGEVPL